MLYILFVIVLLIYYAVNIDTYIPATKHESRGGGIPYYSCSYN